MTLDGKRIPCLDALRGIALLLVLCQHTLAINDTVTGIHWLVVMKLRQIGWSGVDLFFVLSGFLVGGLLCREYQLRREISAGRFLIRRGFKIYPPFYLFLLATFFFYLFEGRTIESRQWLGECLFLQNYLGRVWKHTWSLAVEEHFYLLIALAFWIGSRTRVLERPFLVVTIGLLSLAGLLCLRLWATTAIPYDMETHYVPTHLRIDSLLFGTMLAYAWHFHSSATTSFVRRFRWLLLPLALLCLMPLLQRYYWQPFMHSFGFTLNYIGFGVLLMLGITRAWSLPFGWMRYASNGFAALGRHSYSIYLWHMVAFHAIDQTLPQSIPFEARFFAHTGMYIPAAIALGIAAGSCVEVPVLAFRDYVVPARPAAAVYA